MQLKKSWMRLGKNLSYMGILWLGIFACSQTTPNPQNEVKNSDSHEESSTLKSEAPLPRVFNPPSETDNLLDAKALPIPAIKPASSTQVTSSTASINTANAASTTKTTNPISTGKSNYSIQLFADANLEQVQAKKIELEKQLSAKVEMVFDAPYYKLRFGSFESKQEAEDKILEISDLNIQAFVVRQ